MSNESGCWIFTQRGNLHSNAFRRLRKPLRPGLGLDRFAYASSSQSDESNGRINAGGFQQMNLGRSFVDNDSSVQIQEFVGHELFHFAGLDHSPPGSGDPAAHDRVYGCGRYCTQCPSGFVTAGWTSQPGPAQYAYDCADSARQSVCGAMVEVLTQCRTQICGLPQNTNTAQCVGTGSVCCAITVDNCWANMTADLAGRDITLNTIAGMQYGDCIEMGTTNSCMTSMTCTPGTFPMATVPNPMADCFHWPVGFCAGPGMK